MAQPEKTPDISRTRWDVIIIGGGTTGCVLAGRLSEDEARSVLLLEAGPDYRSANAPDAINSDYHSAALDPGAVPDLKWPDLLVRATQTQQPAPFLQGRGLGGGSSINGRAAVRPPLGEFDEWSSGGAEWTPDAVLESFKRLEADQMFGDEPYHGQDGPIPIRRDPIETVSSVHAAMVDGAAEISEPWAADLNAPDQLGISLGAYTGVPGRRFSTNDGYLEPARERPNLRVVGNALVDRVLFEKGRATGVRASIGGEDVTLGAHEIVLSAGTIQTPSILLRSGIGPVDDLNLLGREVVADLPVGRGVQDHVAVILALPLGDHYRAASGQQSQGPFIRTSTRGARDPDRDLLFMCSVPATPSEFPYALLVGMILRTESTGSLRLQSLDPTVNPVVDLCMLSESRDRVRARATYHRLLELAGTPAVTQATGVAIPYQYEHGSGLQYARGLAVKPPAAAATDAELDTWLSAAVGPALHVTSSCPLGSVVGSDCRVIGVDGLHVADLSITPFCPGANPLLTAIMIGERVSHMIESERTR